MERISHGFLGKFKTYKIPVPQVEQKTTEERFAALQDAIKPWEFDPSKLVRIGGYVPSSTPPVETYHLLTEGSFELLTEGGDNIDYDFI